MLEHDTLKIYTFYPPEEQPDFQHWKNSKISWNSPKSALREPISFAIKQENIQTYTAQKRSKTSEWSSYGKVTRHSRSFIERQSDLRVREPFHCPMFRVFFTILTIFVSNLTQFVSIWILLGAAVRWEYAISRFWTLLSSVFSENLHVFLKKVKKHGFLENSCQCNIVRRPHFFLWFWNKKHKIKKSDIKGKSDPNGLWLSCFGGVF